MYAIILKTKEGKLATADQRQLSTKASLSMSVPKWRMISRTVRKLTQAHGWSTKTVHAILHKDLKLSKKLAQNAGQRDDGVRKDVQGARSDDHHGSLTLSDSLPLCESAQDEEGAGWSHPHPGGLKVGVVEGLRNLVAVYFTEAFQQRYERVLRHGWRLCIENS
jgi:hypothetical protein